MNRLTQTISIADIAEGRRNGMSEWISVKDRLPNDYQAVIVSDGGEPEFAIFYKYYYGYGPTFVTPDCYEEEIIEGITHWMPLPEPPKEET